MIICYSLSSICLAFLFQFKTQALLNEYTVLWLSPNLRSYLQLPVIHQELTDPAMHKLFSATQGTCCKVARVVCSEH